MKGKNLDYERKCKDIFSYYTELYNTKDSKLGVRKFTNDYIYAKLKERFYLSIATLERIVAKQANSRES